MTWKVVFFIFIGVLSLIFFPLFFLVYYRYLSLAAPTKADLQIDIRKIVGPVPERWKALAQGGEESGKSMFSNVTGKLAAIYPREIRIDHIYDFYDIVTRDGQGQLKFSWQKLDETVCDIYRTGAKPFFSLSYMPPALSSDGGTIGTPYNWEEWAKLVQETIQRYSGQSTRLCGQIEGSWLSGIHYEVWNEPELESFGKWRIDPTGKSYQTLYFYSSLGAIRAKNVYPFFLGGPALASLKKEWILKFFDFARTNNVKLDFLSWHLYAKDTEDFSRQIGNLDYWLTDSAYTPYRKLPRIISEWGYDSDVNPISDTNIGAAHNIASIRNFIGQNIESAFLFEAKDGVTPSWGILTNSGEEKPRYEALMLLNLLKGQELFIEGEGTFIKALASFDDNKIVLIMVNYDPRNLNNEIVPVTFTNLKSGAYEMRTTYLGTKQTASIQIPKVGVELQRKIIMPPNSVVAVELIPSE